MDRPSFTKVSVYWPGLGGVQLNNNTKAPVQARGSCYRQWNDPICSCVHLRLPLAMATMTARTLFEKVWDAHVVSQVPGGPALLYVDLHLVHEVTSPQAFEGLRLSGRRVRRPELTVATVDHNVSTGDRRLPIADELSARQVAALVRNAREFGIRLFNLDSPEQGIVHVIGPELGLTQPGMTIVCGDSHTSTHGAFGALAFGIGTSEVEHVLATQCVVQTPPRTMEVCFSELPQLGVSPKDLILALIRQIGTAGASGHVIEYTGQAIRAMSMEGRMTVCNMSIEAGARAGMIAPDGKTLAYLAGRREAPAGREWQRAGECLERATERPGRLLRPTRHARCERRAASGHLGHQPWNDDRYYRMGSGPRRGQVGGRPSLVATGAGVHGPSARDSARGAQGRSGISRLMHQCANRGPARGRSGRARTKSGERGASDGRAWLAPGQGCS